MFLHLKIRTGTIGNLPSLGLGPGSTTSSINFTRRRLISMDLSLINPPRSDKRLRTTILTTNSTSPAAALITKIDQQQRKHKRKRKVPAIEPFSTDDITYREAIDLLQRHHGRQKNISSLTVDDDDDSDHNVEELGLGLGKGNAPIATGAEVELVVSELSSTGDSLSVLPEPYTPWVVAVPFALPGERITARVYRHGRGISFGDLIRVENPNVDLRDMSRVRCKYFGKCAGCQYQMLSYEEQLSVKRSVVERAYEKYSGLAPELIPEILPTIPSPQQYGYRTKITPHFDIPSKKYRKENNNDGNRTWEIRIGFGERGRRSVMDIEECPIATPVVNAVLPSVRASVKKQFDTYKKGATLLLRDSLVIPEEGDDDDENGKTKGEHVCITDYHETVRERVGEYLFEFPAGSFFQNNSSILESLTSYVRDAISGRGKRENDEESAARRPKYLVDAYCGSGLFSITLSRSFSKAVGIEISKESIESARRNAILNGIDLRKEGRCDFYAGEAGAIFENEGMKTFPPELTAVVIDPPRKGCDSGFLKQLIEFGPGTVVYVSCNVHTQARDLGVILKSCKEYEIESIRGFDLFPQTAHVESVAVLRRRRTY